MSQTLTSQSELQNNSCINCGACCAYFRVSFYWAEAEDGGGTVPTAITEKLNNFMRCMKEQMSLIPTVLVCAVKLVSQPYALSMIKDLLLVENLPKLGKRTIIMKPVIAPERLMAYLRCQNRKRS
ncbi:hypothetical protein Xhom_02856 [Xenorhabdus hominickii]|uniref:Ferredoxin n=1 Tax=Xenorhabdus hominickii TaxID=351679 RepID=A0A2G0Q6N6_XENHO|nr:hypothetical protein Xhom_02856 [Xenorhabdus hominickii]